MTELGDGGAGNQFLSTAPFSRRDMLKGLAGAGFFLAGPQTGRWLRADDAKRTKRRVAGVVTIYRHNSHADVILGKILEGWAQDGGAGPDLELASLYVDQVGDDDQSVALSKKHGFRLAKTIEEALTCGTDSVAVDGVLSIAEHGKYPTVPETKQVMYPRRRFFDEIAATFRQCGKVVPVFSDKHLAYDWADARAMYDLSRELKIPFMAGSSVPVMWRKPSETIPIGSEITEAIALGYGPLEHYGFHSLEGLQCLVERRKGGETGVRSVQAVRGEAILQAEKEGRWSRSLFDAVVAATPSPYMGRVARPKEMSKDAVFYLIDYLDGTKATVAMGTGFTHEFACGVAFRDKPAPFAVRFIAQEEAPFQHFEHLLRAVEEMIFTGKPSYPVERTLLTTGILDEALRSLADNGALRQTQPLNIAYRPVDWPFAKGLPPTPKKPG